MPEIPLRNILLHPATLFVGCVVLTVAGTVALWEQNSKHFLKSHKYDLTPDRIHIQGQSDLADRLKSEIVNELADKESNTLDTQLVPDIAMIVESKPYVQASYVKKSIERLDIEATFRYPVAIVELESLPIAVDSQGTLLDGRVYKMESPDDFLRISIPRPENKGLSSWQVWPDPRIPAAAHVCDEIKDVWKEFGLYRVVSYWVPGQAPKSTDVFELWTAYGDKIIWSNAAADDSQVPAEQKIALVRNFIAENGSLDKLAGRNKLDVRTGQAVLQKDIRTAERNRLLFSKLQDFFTGKRR